jgi:hypothetical protein
MYDEYMKYCNEEIITYKIVRKIDEYDKGQKRTILDTANVDKETLMLFVDLIGKTIEVNFGSPMTPCITVREITIINIEYLPKIKPSFEGFYYWRKNKNK